MKKKKNIERPFKIFSYLMCVSHTRVYCSVSMCTWLQVPTDARRGRQIFPPPELKLQAVSYELPEVGAGKRAWGPLEERCVHH